MSGFEHIKTRLLKIVGTIWEDFIDHIPFLFAGILSVAFTWILASSIAYLMRRYLKKISLRKSLQELATRLVTFAVWGVGVLVTAMVVFPGVTPANVLGTLGIASIAIGFAFKDIFENFFAGILILWRFPIEPGDFIECEGVMGRVVQVTVRNTHVLTPTDELVVMPNSIIFKNPVDVLTYKKSRRVTLITSVAYAEDVKKSVDVIKKAVENCESLDPDKHVEVFPKEFADSGIEIEVAWWTKPTPLEQRSSRAEVVTQIKEALDKAGIEIPFPYRTLTFKEPLKISSN